MLRELTIRNFAIIDDLTVGFDAGLTILSGETGAGKSIIINAVNLLLGSRASSKMVRTGAEAAELEALFDIVPDSHAFRTMTELGYDPADGLVIRRILSADDRHRIYINGRLATMANLAAITGNLASISGQHAHQRLLDTGRHLDILDAYGRLLKRRATVAERVQALTAAVAEYDSLCARQRKRSDQSDLLAFQVSEIQSAAIEPDEDLQLEQERQRLKNADVLHQAAQTGYAHLYSQDSAVVEQLQEQAKQLARAGELDGDLAVIGQRLEALAFQVEDVAGACRQYLDTLDMDAGRLEAVEARLDELNRLKRKYGGSMLAVLDHLATAEGELSQLEDLDSALAELEARIVDLREKAIAAARDLSDRRHAAAGRLAKGIAKELAALEMDGTTMTVELSPVPAPPAASIHLQDDGRLLTDSGVDRAEFCIAPNVGEGLKPLGAIASGGELSRVVLAVKALLAKTDAVGTIVFDEVDAGIGGRTAERVGEKLAALAQHHQIICITHLPQIAKFATHHYRIDKRVMDGRTSTVLQPLDMDARVDEMARMLGGLNITQATLTHAREMLGVGS